MMWFSNLNQALVIGDILKEISHFVLDLIVFDTDFQAI